MRLSWSPSPPLILLPRGGGGTASDDEDDKENVSAGTFGKEEQEIVDPPLLDDLPPLDMNEEEHNKNHEDDDESREDEQLLAGDSEEHPSNMHHHYRRASDIIVDLVPQESSSSLQLESSSPQHQLPRVFLERKQEFLDDCTQAVAQKKKLPRPKRLLHSLAPKIPALKHSPDITLRIVSAESNVDSGLAASLLATLAHVCELMGHNHDNGHEAEDHHKKKHDTTTTTPAQELLKERRLEQLVECLVCGVDVPKRTREYWKLELDPKRSSGNGHHHDSDSHQDSNNDMLDELLMSNGNEDPPPIQEGLSVRDCCRAAWGLVVLGAHKQETLSDVKVVDLIRALSLRARELLLRRMQLMCQDDLWHVELGGGSGPHQQQQIPLEQRLHQVAQEIAQDAAASLWAFGCVRALSGIRSTALFQVCATILCQNPTELRHRAQQEFLPMGNNIGSNDVVEKLARSNDELKGEPVPSVQDDHPGGGDDVLEEGNTKEATANPPYSENPIIEGTARHNDDDSSAVLVDFLSPIEVSDVLWALASHGEKEAVTQSKFESVELSETAATLCDVAFDRALAWLKHDTQSLEAAAITKDERTKKTEPSADESLEVAATDASATTGPMPEHIEDEGGKIVDAATLLALEQEQEQELDAEEPKDAGGIPMSEDDFGATQESAVYDAGGPNSVDQGGMDGLEECETDEIDNGNGSQTYKVPDIIYGPADLCSLAWAATELKDSLRLAVVEQVTRNVFLLGPLCLATRSGSAISTLAQTISNAVVEGGGTDSDCLTVLDWIAEDAFQSVNPSYSSVDTETPIRNLMKRFQPPSLSRLVFAIAAARCSTGDVRPNESVVGLTSLALDAAFENPDVFGPEDLACIVFAHLEMAYPSLSSVDKPVVEHKLGVLLAVIEIALLNWESGASVSSNLKHTNLISRGLSFFGRRWFDIDHHSAHDSSPEDADEFDGLPGMLMEKAHRPLLRDFPIDPSTLSKLTWSSSRLSSSTSASDTLSRVALQLFTSKSGRLLRECEAFDLSSIARAADTVSASRRELVSLFSRRLVRVLNESPRVLGASPPIHSAALLFSLGRLGVCYRPDQNSDSYSYRRLQLTSPLPNFSKAEFDKLPTQILVYLLRAAGTLNILSYDSDFVKDIISAVERRLATIDAEFHGRVVRGLVEGLGAILETVQHTKTPQPKGHNTTEASEIGESDLVETGEIIRNCKLLLTEIANTILPTRLGSMTSSDIRRVVHVYTILPIQADILIDETEAEIEARKKHYLEESEIQYDPSELMSQFAANADFVRQALSGGEDTGKGFSALRNGLFKKLFGSATVNGSNTDPRHQYTDQSDKDAAGDEKSVSRNVELVQALDFIIAWGDAISDRSKKRKEGDDKGDCSVLVELGRCQELIAHYRRHDFDSGTRRSRLDEDSRRDMTKRLMSRLLP